MSPEIRRLIQAIRDAVDYMDIDDACNELEALCNELEALLASQRPPTEERKVVCTCRHDSGVSSDCDVHPPAEPSPADPQPEKASGTWCINCFRPFYRRGEYDLLRYYYGAGDDEIGPFCESCDRIIKTHTRFVEAGHPSTEAQKDETYQEALHRPVGDWKP